MVWREVYIFVYSVLEHEYILMIYIRHWNFDQLYSLSYDCKIIMYVQYRDDYLPWMMYISLGQGSDQGQRVY